MNDPPWTPTFPPRRGFTPEEQQKIAAFIAAGKMTICPGPEKLAAIRAKEALAAFGIMSLATKRKLGFIAVRLERTENEKKERQREHARKWLRKQKHEVEE